MKISEKLKINFWVLSNFQKVFYLSFYRWFISRKDRVFFEGSLFLPGQMYMAERKALYDVVINEKPDYCFEIGTYTGGGSTYFLSKALRDNNKGKLITIESDIGLYNKAVMRYSRFIKSNRRYVEFIHSNSPDVFFDFLNKNNCKIMLFLDGSNDSRETLDQYNFFLKYFKSGSIIALHDWNSAKTAQVQPVIEQSHLWEKVVQLDQPASIGFRIFKHK
ncbi:MAG: class I SAM-dependent methyltransferase [Candidatus Taylorbacteria bacterium]